MRPAVAVPLLVVAGVVVGAAICELALRIAVPGAPDLRAIHMAEPDKPWLYRLRPGAEAELDKTGGVHYRVNADGFRGPRYAREHPDGAFRIAVLGDSLTFGFGVDEADVYTAQLEALLAQSLAPRKVEVLNFGVGGYNAYNEATLYEGLAADYAPDLVLVQFCINDLNDPRLHFDAHTLSLLDLPDAAFPDPAVRALPMPDKSPLAFCAGRLRLCDLLQHALFEDRADRQAVARAVAPRASLQGAERDWLRARYDELAHAAAAHGAAFGVIVFPYPKQLKEPPRDRLPRDIVELGREDGWTAIDLTPAYRAAIARGDDSLFLDLWHPNPLGHRVAAQALAEELPRLGLMPPAQGVGAR